VHNGTARLDVKEQSAPPLLLMLRFFLFPSFLLRARQIVIFITHFALSGALSGEKSMNAPRVLTTNKTLLRIEGEGVVEQVAR
jgi:hypothetical protein